MKTNRNSRNFSIFLAVMMVVVSLVDLPVMINYTLFGAMNNLGMQLQYLEEHNPLSTPEAAETTPAPEQLSEDADVQALAAALAELPGNATATPAPMTEEEWQEQQAELLLYSFEASIDAESTAAIALGFGGSFPLFFLAPPVLLFSYTKAPRHPKIGLYFPAGAMLVILILYLEGTRLLLWRLPLHKVDLKEMSEYIRTVFLMLK